MKFTKETLPVNDSSVYDDGRNIEPVFDISIGTTSKKETTEIRDQILENQEKAELYNPIFKEFYDNWHHILQENKSLKEEIKENQAIVEKSNKYQSQLSALHAKSELSYFEMLQVIDRLQKLLDSKIEKQDFGTIRKFITINEIETVLKIDSECKGATS